MKQFLVSALGAAFALSLTFGAAAALPDDVAERDQMRRNFISGVSCRYLPPGATATYTFERSGVLLLKFRTVYRQGGWQVDNDEFCMSNPINGKQNCVKLRRGQMRDQETTLAFFNQIKYATCRK